MNGADLQGVHLDNAVLNRAHLHGVILWESYLRGTDFVEASLTEAGLGDALIQGSLLLGAKLCGAALCGAQLQGAALTKAHLQEAYLNNVQLQGVRSSRENDWLAFSKQTFTERMKASVGQSSDLSEVIFSGGLRPENMDLILEGFSEENAQRIRERLQSHIGGTVSHELPGRSGAVTGAYTEEESERWIAEMKK